MRKKSTSQKKGIPTGISKHKVRNATQQRRHAKSQTIFGLQKWKIFDLGQRSVEFIFLVAAKLQLVGFTRNENHEYVLLCGTNKLLHRLVISVLLLICCQKTWGTLHMLIHEELRLETFLCITLTLVYWDAFMIGFGLIVKPEETIDVLNSWPQILKCLGEMDGNLGNMNEFHDVSSSLKVIAVLLVHQGIAFNGPMFTLIKDDLPITLFQMAKGLGCFPDEGTVSTIWWKLLLFPLEYLSYIPPTIITACGMSILLVSLGVLKIYLRELGNFRVVDMRSRGVMEKMHQQLTVFSRVVHVWMCLVLPLELLVLSVTIIVVLFVTFRYTQLPILFYLSFPCGGLTVMFMIFGQCYDMLEISRAAEDNLDRLWSHKAPYLRMLGKIERTRILKKAKAMQPLVFPIGDSKFSLSLPVIIWEEILNQIVLLLSL